MLISSLSHNNHELATVVIVTMRTSKSSLATSNNIAQTGMYEQLQRSYMPVWAM